MDSILLNDSSDDDSAARGQAPAPSAPAPLPPPTVHTTQPGLAPPPAAPGPQPAAPSGGSYKERLKSLYSPAQQQRMRSGNAGPPGAGMPPQQQPPSAPAPQPPPQRPRQMSAVNPGGSMASRQSSSSYNAPPMPNPGGPPPRGMSNDPFAPTPVSQMRGPPGQPPQQSQHRTSASSYQPSSGGPSSSASNPAPHLGRGSSSSAQYGRANMPPMRGGSVASSSASSRTMQASNRSMPGGGNSGGGGPGGAAAAVAQRERDLKKQKETFLLFTRVLIKYLEQKDPHVHSQVKAIIKDCAERNKRGEPGYESVTASMRSRLKQVVSENYWSRAEAYLRQLLSQKQKGGGSGASGSTAPTATSGRSAQQPSSLGAPTSKGVPPPTQHLRQPMQPTGASVSSAASRRMPPSNARSTNAADRAAALQKDLQARRNALQKPQQPTNKYAPPPASGRSTGQSASSAGATGGPKGSVPPYSGGPPSSANSATSTGTSTTSKSKSSSSKRQTSAKSSTSPTTPTQRKTSLSNVSTHPASSSAAPAPVAAAAQVEPMEKIPPVIIKEYSEYHDLLDHAMNMQDWQSTPLVLGQKTHAMATEEQKKMLYRPPQMVAPSSQIFSFPRPGWGQENIVSVRNAWAKIRLREKKLHGSAGNTLVVPIPSGERKQMHVTSWFNDDVNEEDAVLAALSEGAQIYIKSILEKAIYCARQRQNVDGIRLWHNQVMRAAAANGKDSKKDKNKGKDNCKDEDEPSLSLRLGCDVQRQVARSEANAALINKRMEEALERQNDLPARKRVLDEDTLEQASSMSDIALRPRLARGVDEAELEAARANEIVGGKFASEPPLGRIPKKAKLEVVDFQNGMQLALRPGIHRASVISGAFSF